MLLGQIDDVELVVLMNATEPALIIGIPLAVSIVLMLFGRRIGPVSGWLASAAVAVSFVVGIVQFFAVATAEEIRGSARLLDWIEAGGFEFPLEFLVDQLSMTMVLVVTGVGFLIHVYSIAYMHDDPGFHRYFAYLNLFVASMLLLVLAGNLVLLYVGWEAVGLCSYLLIGFWFDRPAAHNAAKKAFFVNRIGDFAFLVGIFVLATEAGSLTFGTINEQAGAMSAGVATAVSLLLFTGAAGKSAQIPLYVWLPDAMEGPTPVSALIHAATMVTAGVYMVARLSPVFEASEVLLVVGWIGALTALWAALMAAAEYDIKRVLAYSTISQLGYMFLAHGVGAYAAGMFHLVTHAFFKALMFLGAGAVMHALAGETDMRRMSGLRKEMPVTGWSFAAGWLAICGIIPFAGFWSKDAILASAWHEGQYVLWAIGVMTALLTAFYMSRLYFRVFEGPVKLPEGAHPHDAPPTMAFALVPLGGLAAIGGIINLPGLLTLEVFLEPVVGHSEVPSGLAPFVLAALALLVAVTGIAVARALYWMPGADHRREALYGRARPLVDAARNKFYVDEIYGRAVVLPGKAFAGFCAGFVDAGVIDGAVNGMGRGIAGLSQRARRVQTGYVRNYAAAFLVGVVVIFTLLVAQVMVR